MKIILSVIYFIICYVFFLKKWYELFAITKVYIPDFNYSKTEFVNEIPLNILKKRKNQIIVLIITINIMVAMFFYGITFYLMLASLIFSFITCLLTFKAIVFENKIFSIFSDYLTKWYIEF